MVNSLKIFRHEFLYTTCADDTTFFFKDIKSTIELMTEFNAFSNFQGLNLITQNAKLRALVF